MNELHDKTPQQLNMMVADADYVRSILDYNKNTGVFTRKVSVSGNALKGSVVGTRDKDGYLTVVIREKFYKLHRLAFLHVNGAMPSGDVDHINGDASDNRWDNLRDVTSKENNRNAKIRKDNSSGVTGVSFVKSSGRWMAQIKGDFKNIYLGSYGHIFDAAAARKSAEIKQGYHKNHGRAPC